MSNLFDIKKTINFLKKNNFDIKNNLTLLHCVSSYPTNIHDMNLRFIHTLRKTLKLKWAYLIIQMTLF